MKKLLTIILVVCFVFAMSATAFAADGDVPTAPTSASHNPGESSGNSTVSHDGTNFHYANDDDASASDLDTNGADIAVWAKITDATGTSTNIVYKVDIAWGAMAFTYDKGQGTWDPDTHTYAGNPTGAGWSTDDLDATKNKITVTNHTNKALTAGLAFTAIDGVLNADADEVTSVHGNFFADNTEALAAAAVTGNVVTGVQDRLAGDSLALASAADTTLANAPTANAYFALSGTPDATATANGTNFTKFGTITVTIS